jgi:hypothetical protein
MYEALGKAAAAGGVSKSRPVAIAVLYVIVVLLGFAGIHVPTPGFR